VLYSYGLNCNNTTSQEEKTSEFFQIRRLNPKRNKDPGIQRAIFGAYNDRSDELCGIPKFAPYCVRVSAIETIQLT
jgi:hypothetical protein